MCSGPWKSYSLAGNRDVARVVALSVDCVGSYNPDVEARLEEWNPWRFCLENYSVDRGTRVLLPFHVHCSPLLSIFSFDDTPDPFGVLMLLLRNSKFTNGCVGKDDLLSELVGSTHGAEQLTQMLMDPVG